MIKEDTCSTNLFPKTEKLCSQKSIDRLFTKGNSFISYPLRIVYFVEEETDTDHQYPKVLISVSKKRFKRAVKRNRIKRLIREAYRLNKSPYLEFLKSNNKRMDIAFLYVKDDLPTYDELAKSIAKAANMLIDKANSK